MTAPALPRPRARCCCSRAAVLALVAAFGCAPPATSQASQDDSAGVELRDRTADFERLQEWALIDRALSTSARRAALRRASELAGAGEPISDVDFFLAVASVTALADNGHSNVNMAPAWRFGLVPVRFFWFSDGPHVVRARTDLAELLGARIDSIEGRSVDDLAEALGAYHGGTTEQFRHYYAAPLMLSPALLHAAGLAADGHRLAYTVTDGGGTSRRVTLSAEPDGSQPSRVRPWRLLAPEPIEGEDGAWSVYRAPGEPALALGEPDETWRYVRLPEHEAVYVQLRANIGPARSMQEFAADASRRIREDAPRIVILDNRTNPGGDLTRTADFALELPSLLPDGGVVYSLTSNATFSAGIYTAFYPKAADPIKTVVLGERVGDRERFWAETWTPFLLPDSGYRLAYSLQMHDLGEGCPDEERCHLAGRERLDVALGSLDPDVEIPYRFADFAAGRDPVLEYALERAGN